MSNPALHLLGLFHTQTTLGYSHCAFTGKVLRFPKMMQRFGYEVIEYSNYGSESTADEHVEILNEQEFQSFFGERKATDFFGDHACVGSPAHQLFEERLIVELRRRLKDKDIICHPFGHAHQKLLAEFPNHHHVETGIGYPTLMPGSFRIFESYAWMHYHQGKENRQGKNYEWVVPNYFDLDDWEPKEESGDYLAFLGRICSAKGLDTIRAIADYSPWPIILHGQGDPSPWEHPNIFYEGPISGIERSNFLRNARAALMPTNFTEPFGGSGVEAMLCGTPLIAVDYGAFTETIVDGVTGFRCHTLQDWIDAIEKAGDLDRKQIARITRDRYSLEACGKKYDKIFQDINALWDKGWYKLRETGSIDYIHLDTEERPFAKRLARWIDNHWTKPNLLIDLGCGPGTYVECFNELGIEAIGYDIDPRVEGTPNLFCEDLLSVEPKRKADVVLCMEVAEHMDSSNNEEIPQAILRCLRPGGFLIWTAAAPGQGGVGHINCQLKEYWKELFSRTPGLCHMPEVEQALIKDMQNGYHMGWFTQNLLVYCQQ
jgi:glycosyltransferase involved in cell wall biosynthesis